MTMMSWKLMKMRTNKQLSPVGTKGKGSLMCKKMVKIVTALIATGSITAVAYFIGREKGYAQGIKDSEGEIKDYLYEEQDAFPMNEEV